MVRLWTQADLEGFDDFLMRRLLNRRMTISSKDRLKSRWKSSEIGDKLFRNVLA